MTRRIIEFKTTPTATEPLKPSTGTSFRDELLRPEFCSRQLRLKTGPNWLRILPALDGSSAGWMFDIHALAGPRCKFAHPSTLQPGATSVWDDVYAHLQQTNPSRLYSRVHRDGLKLLAHPLTICWVLARTDDTDDSPYLCRLLILSRYKGEKGGDPGLGHQILGLADDRDENGELQHPIAGANPGVRICIEKIVTKESRYPRYFLRAGRVEAPIQHYLDRLAPGEADALCPVEHTIRSLTDDEQWERLAHQLPKAEIEALRAKLGR